MTTGENTPEKSARDTARYIENMTKELKALAAGDELDFIAYFLSMVEAEAAAAARRSK